MITEAQVLRRIAAAVEAAGSLRKFAVSAGLSPAYVSRVLRGDIPPASARLLRAVDLADLHWVIYGGESGAGFRQDNTDWAREMRDKCTAAGASFFYKQRAALKPGTDSILDGVVHHAWPA